MISDVADVVRENQCISCGACEFACSLSAISIALDRTRGIYRPVVDETRCTHCGHCLKVCFGVNTDYTPYMEIRRHLKSTFGRCVASYSAFAADMETRYSASSGGVVTALLESMFDQGLVDGALVAELEPGPLPLAKSFIARSSSDLEAAKGSKYCPVRMNSALRQLQDGETYVFVGLPCQLFGIQRLLESGMINGSAKLYVGLFCAGMPSYNGIRYLLEKHGIRNQYIRKMEYRGGGWPGRLLIETESVCLGIPFPEYWPIISPWFLLDRCLVCLSALSSRSDISCGDLWLPGVMRNDTMGTSVVVARTKAGEDAIRSASNKGYLVVQAIGSRSVFLSQKDMLAFKHLRFIPRISMLSMLGRSHLFGGLLHAQSIHTKPRLFFDELLLHMGRAFASKRGLWPLLHYFTTGMRLQRLFIASLRRRKGLRVERSAGTMVR